jgi:hypothetical protein
MKALCLGLIFASAILVGCASKSEKSTAAPADDAWAIFFPQKAHDLTGKLALSYELHPVRLDTRTPDIQFPLRVIVLSPLPSVNRNEGFEAGSLIPGTPFYRGDLIDTVPHPLK